MSKLISFMTGSGIIIAFVCFLVFSYLIVALMTWSLIKPFKYLGIPIIISGILCVVCKFSINSISRFLLDDASSFLSLLTNNGSYFLTFGLTLIILGICLEVLYLVLKTNLVLKKTIKTYDEEPNVVGDKPEIEIENDEKQV